MLDGALEEFELALENGGRRDAVIVRATDAREQHRHGDRVADAPIVN